MCILCIPQKLGLTSEDLTNGIHCTHKTDIMCIDRYCYYAAVR